MYLFVTEEPKNLCGQRFEMSCPPVRLIRYLARFLLTDKFFCAVSFGFLTRELPSSVEPGDEDDEIFHNTVSSFLLP
jgi:hypothetical protein